MADWLWAAVMTEPRLMKGVRVEEFLLKAYVQKEIVVMLSLGSAQKSFLALSSSLASRNSWFRNHLINRFWSWSKEYLGIRLVRAQLMSQKQNQRCITVVGVGLGKVKLDDGQERRAQWGRGHNHRRGHGGTWHNLPQEEAPQGFSTLLKDVSHSYSSPTPSPPQLTQPKDHLYAA